MTVNTVTILSQASLWEVSEQSGYEVEMPVKSKLYPTDHICYYHIHCLLVFTHHEARAGFHSTLGGLAEVQYPLVLQSPLNLQELSLHPFPTLPLPSHLFMTTILT